VLWSPLEPVAHYLKASALDSRAGSGGDDTFSGRTESSLNACVPTFGPKMPLIGWSELCSSRRQMSRGNFPTFAPSNLGPDRALCERMPGSGSA
jgi:hypothetical protein